MSTCYVPLCKTGYASQREAFKKLGKKVPSLFSCSSQDNLEKWNRAILRSDRPLTSKSKVCALHFKVKDINRHFIHKFPDGSIQVFEREKPFLKRDAIPTIFPKSTRAKKAKKRFAESNFEKKSCTYDSKKVKRLSEKLSNAHLKKCGPSLCQNSKNYLSKKRYRKLDVKEKCIISENEEAPNPVQQNLESSVENQDQSENAVATLPVPINMHNQIDLDTSNHFHWNKNEMTALIALYQSEKCLYDKNHEHYYNLHERNKACERIKNVLANMNFIRTVQQIENQIISLHTAYVCEKAHKDRCIQAGQFTENTYAPTMWCFGLLQFLDDFIEPSMEIQVKTEVMQEDQHEIQLLKSDVDHLNIKVEPEEVSNTAENVPFKINLNSSLNTGFKGNLEVNEKRMEASIQIPASNNLNAIKMFSQDLEEKEDIFGEYIASEMKTLKDSPLIYMRTKQAILNIITNANFNFLTS